MGDPASRLILFAFLNNDNRVFTYERRVFKQWIIVSQHTCQVQQESISMANIIIISDRSDNVLSFEFHGELLLSHMEMIGRVARKRYGTRIDFGYVETLGAANDNRDNPHFLHIQFLGYDVKGGNWNSHVNRHCCGSA